MASTEGSVTRLLPGIRSGDASAQTKLWQRFRGSLERIARSSLKPVAARLFDEEEVMTDAVCSVLRRLQDGQYPQLHDRDGLWRLLSTVTLHKAVSCNRFATRGKRNGSTESGGHELLTTLPAGGQSFAEVAETEDFVRHLLTTLPDNELRQICMMRLSGFTTAEIASETGRSIPTIDRRLRVLRAVWADAIARIQ